MPHNQEYRLLRIDTVLGKDHVLLVSLRGRDAISSRFFYDLELASTGRETSAPTPSSARLPPSGAGTTPPA